MSESVLGKSHLYHGRDRGKVSDTNNHHFSAGSLVWPPNQLAADKLGISGVSSFSGARQGQGLPKTLCQQSTVLGAT